MASTRFIVIINGEVVTHEGEEMIEVVEEGKKYFTTRNSGKNLKREFKEYLDRVVKRESGNPLYEAVTVKETDITYNKELKFLIYTTPLYKLQLNLLTQPHKVHDLMRDRSIDVSAIWNEQRDRFLADFFFTYAQIMNKVEAVVSHRNGSGRTPFTVSYRKGNKAHQMMTILSIFVSGISSPYRALKSQLEVFDLFKPMYDSDFKFDYSRWDRPLMFRTEALRHVDTVMGTSSDLLSMCGIKTKRTISSANFHRLLGGMILRMEVSEFTPDKLTNSTMLLPTNVVLYQAVDSNGVPVDGTFYLDIPSAKANNPDEEIRIIPIDSTTNFVKDAFPEVKGQELQKLIQDVRSAEFVF